MPKWFKRGRQRKLQQLRAADAKRQTERNRQQQQLKPALPNNPLPTSDVTAATPVQARAATRYQRPVQPLIRTARQPLQRPSVAAPIRRPQPTTASRRPQQHNTPATRSARSSML